MKLRVNFCLLISSFVSSAWLHAAAPPNVLLIVSDDLNARLGCYGEGIAKTPNIDGLAKHGVLFERAYCQFPHCNPSRSSFLTGMRPRTTRVTNNEDSLYQNIPGVMTLPRWFREHGYATARCGKIFHLGVPSGDESMDDPRAWDFGTPFKDERPYPKARASAVKVETGKKKGIGWQETECSDDDLVDGNFARTAVEWLERRDAARPFFLAVGFHRPHLPLVAPAKYFDLYPFDAIKLPDEPADDVDDIPPPARNGAVPGYAITTTPDQRRAAIRAYLATVSFMDAQAGRVLDAVQRLGLSESTIVIFMSDHGWHLGEHGLWHKRSLFEECARVPFIIRAPGAGGNGRHSAGLVELLDLFPTLCDLTGVPAPAQIEGKSLRPLLNDPAAIAHEAVVTEARRGTDAEFWGRSIRTPRWRYTEWNGGRDGVELYDHDADPHEFANLAGDERHAGTISQLKKMLAPLAITPAPAKPGQ
ncbi:MAG: sulfatase [Verrucomicrobiaceae bacterium]|nr:sulfatase [Verrucomicrobiaceae bacterium]